MRSRSPLALILCLPFLSACSGESEAAYEAGSGEPAAAESGALPTDAEGLASGYAEVLDEATAALKTVKDEETARAASDLLATLRPRAEALMAKAEELGLSSDVEEKYSATIDAAIQRMQAAMQEAIQAYPMGAMMLSSAFGDGFGG